MKQFNLEKRCRRRSRRPPVYKPVNRCQPDVMHGLNQDHRRDGAGLTGRERCPIRRPFARTHRIFARTPGGRVTLQTWPVRHAQQIEHCAVVGDRAGKSWMTRLSRLISVNAEIRFFDKTKCEQAYGKRTVVDQGQTPIVSSMIAVYPDHAAAQRK